MKDVNAIVSAKQHIPEFFGKDNINLFPGPWGETLYVFGSKGGTESINVELFALGSMKGYNFDNNVTSLICFPFADMQKALRVLQVPTP